VAGGRSKDRRTRPLTAGGDGLLFSALPAVRRGPKQAMEQSLPQELVKQVGGSFRLTALLQKRVRELVRGQRPLFETRERNYIKIASEELKRGLIELVVDEEQTGPTKLEV